VDETAYYYAQRHYHSVTDADEALPAEDDQNPEMIYIEEDVVS
jgi:hypothetical protein